MNEYMYAVLRDNGIAVKTDENIGMEFFEMSQLGVSAELQASGTFGGRPLSGQASKHSSVQRESQDQREASDDEPGSERNGVRPSVSSGELEATQQMNSAIEQFTYHMRH